MRAGAEYPQAPRSRSGGVWVVGVAALTVVVPLCAVAALALVPNGSLSVESFSRILSQPRTWRVILGTVAQALASSLVTVAVGAGVAWVLSRYRFYGRTILRTVVTVPFVLPSVVVGTAFASLLGPQGLLDARGTWWIVIAAHVSFNIAVVVRTVGAAVEGLDANQESAARVLGARKMSAFQRVILPSLAPSLISSGIVVFLFCLTSFGVIVVVGGGSVTTMEVEIWTRATMLFDLPGAGVLCLVQFGAVLVTVCLHSWITRRNRRSRAVASLRAAQPTTTGQRVSVAAASAVVIVVAGLPLGALIERSLRVSGGYGLEHWAHLGSVLAGSGLEVSAVEAIRNSVSVAAIAAAVAVIAAVPAARVAARRPGGLSEQLLLVPLGVSATTVGLGLLIALGRPPVDLRSSAILVPLAQMSVALPLVVRVILPGIRSIPESLDDAAAILGTPPLARLIKVELPLIRPAIVAAVGLGFVTCMGEFGATVFLSRSNRPTMPVAIARLMSRPGEAGMGQAMVLSVIMALTCGLVLMGVDFIGARRGGRALVF